MLYVSGVRGVFRCTGAALDPKFRLLSDTGVCKTLSINEMNIMYIRLFPIVMCAANVLILLVTLVVECRIKPNVLRYALAYAACIRPALNGNMEPFMQVLTTPGD